MVGWLVGSLLRWSVGWLVGWSVGWLVGWLVVFLLFFSFAAEHFDEIPKIQKPQKNNAGQKKYGDVVGKTTKKGGKYKIEKAKPMLKERLPKYGIGDIFKFLVSL